MTQSIYESFTAERDRIWAERDRVWDLLEKKYQETGEVDQELENILKSIDITISMLDNAI